MTNYLGIDLGTSEIKILLLTDQHKIIATKAKAITLSRPKPLWSEQNPSQWWDATSEIMDQFAQDYPQEMEKVAAIGLSGQMHGAVLLDQKDDVLRPAILWNDGRSALECAELTASVPNLTDIAGNIAMPGFTAPKICWVAKHEPDIFSKMKCVLLPKDWLRFQLCGEKVSDMSDAAGSLWLDVAKRDWSDTLLQACQLNRSHMPKLVEGSAFSGLLKPELCQRWKLSNKVIIAGGGGDNAASAVGIGAINTGDGFISLGTSGVLFVCNQEFSPNPASAVHAFCHALPQRWHQMSVMLSAASCLKWVTTLTNSENEAQLIAQVAKLSLSEKLSSPLFLPYLSGERTPHNNPHAQGIFFGLNFNHGAAALAYAVLEGVAFGLRDGLSALQAAGTQVSQLSLVGGGARSVEWAQLIATILNVKIITHSGSEAGGALGAARLAWLAHEGEISDARIKQICASPPISAEFYPDSSLQIDLNKRYEKFRRIYQNAKTEFIPD